MVIHDDIVGKDRLAIYERHLDGEQRDELGDVGAWLDTPLMTPDETVAAILSEMR